MGALRDRRFSPLRGILFLMILAGISGCGAQGIERATVSGTVTADGQPVPWGEIRFIPTGRGQVWSADIRDGKYVTEGKGVTVGEFRVEITALRSLKMGGPPQRPVDVEDDNFSEPSEQYLPAKYNFNSELKFTIPPGSGTVEKNFELSSK